MTRKQPKKQDFEELYINEVKNKKAGEYVKNIERKVGFLPKRITEQTHKVQSREIYASSRVLMHLKDKREKVLEEVILPTAYTLLNHPDAIYENSKIGDPKRGDILLTKKLRVGQIQVAVLELRLTNKGKRYSLVTIFVARENYTEQRRCLWRKSAL